MTLPPHKKKPTILTRLKINEVSLCDRGAGEGCRVIISKRADDDIDDWYKKEAAEEDRQNGVHDSDWYKQQADTAKRQNEELLREDAEREEREKSVISAARKRFQENWNKAFADDAGDETVSAGNDHHASKVADLLVESGKHPDRRAALDHLLHTAQGAAMLRRLRKHEDQPTMTDYKDKLRDLAKRAGPIAIAKVIVEDDNAYGISEHDLTALVTECAKREHPQLSDAQAFVKVFTDQSEGGTVLRRAFNVVKSAQRSDNVTSYPHPKF